MENANHFDKDKEPLDLLPKAALFAVAKVLAAGAKKYGEKNWEKGMEWRKPIASALRHIYKFLDKEDIDPETLTNHIANACCNLMFILHYYEKRIGNDNR